MLSIFVFLDITKVANLRWRNSDVSRTQGVCRVIYIFFGSSLGKLGINVASFIVAGYVWQFIGKGGLFAPHPWAALKRPILNRVEWIKVDWEFLIENSFSTHNIIPGIFQVFWPIWIIKWTKSNQKFVNKYKTIQYNKMKTKYITINPFSF